MMWICVQNNIQSDGSILETSAHVSKAVRVVYFNNR